jgi:aspartyl protease family protein
MLTPLHAARPVAAGLLSLALLCVPAGPAQADPGEVTLVGVFPGRAVLAAGHGVPHTLRVGQSADGVTLVSVASDSAVVEVEGVRRTLQLGQPYAAPAAAAGAGSLVLTADPNGHFFAQATINGGSLRVLVDTGASLVAIPSRDAERMGLRYLDGTPITLATANGTATGYRIRLDTVRLGTISISGVDAVVQDSGLSMPLLGMSFLSRTTMQRDGDRMTLVKRF